MASRSPESPIDQLLRYLWDGPSWRAEEWLVRHPDLSASNIACAAATGNLKALDGFLKATPHVIHEATGPFHSTPLLYACFSKFLRIPTREAGVVAVARRLVDLGADVNAIHIGHHPEWKLSCLYGASGRANHAGLTKLLLQAGANPNDNESLYHSAEFKNLECTRLLLEAGARVEGTNAIRRKLDFEDPAGLELLLSRSPSAGEVDEGGCTLLHHAILNGRSRSVLECLKKFGTPLRSPNKRGHTPFLYAVVLGHRPALDFLRENGATHDLGNKEQLLGACALGDEIRVRELIEMDPSLASAWNEMDHHLLSEHAWRGNHRAVALLLEVGMPVAALNMSGQTALHNACWMGDPKSAQILIRAGADLEAKEPQYQATPMGWVLHGSVNSRNGDGEYLLPGADHPAVASLLLEAGVEPPDPLPDDLDPPMQAVFKRT